MNENAVSRETRHRFSVLEEMSHRYENDKAREREISVLISSEAGKGSAPLLIFTRLHFVYCRVTLYILDSFAIGFHNMIIRNVRHKGLRLLMEADDEALLPQASVSKIRVMLSFLQDMASEQELRSIPSWKAHQLTGNRKGVWALHVTKNWRITFRIDRQEIEIIDLDYEDYH